MNEKGEGTRECAEVNGKSRVGVTDPDMTNWLGGGRGIVGEKIDVETSRQEQQHCALAN